MFANAHKEGLYFLLKALRLLHISFITSLQLCRRWNQKSDAMLACGRKSLIKNIMESDVSSRQGLQLLHGLVWLTNIVVLLASEWKVAGMVEGQDTCSFNQVGRDQGRKPSLNCAALPDVCLNIIVAELLNI